MLLCLHGSSESLAIALPPAPFTGPSFQFFWDGLGTGLLQSLVHLYNRDIENFNVFMIGDFPSFLSASAFNIIYVYNFQLFVQTIQFNNS